jgi:putative ABC transport system permease protein
MLIPRLALASLRSRRLTTGLTVASIALSVTLLVGIESVRAGVRDSFAGTIRGVDLIVGARGGTLQVLLSSVFGIGSPAGSIKLSTMERWKAHPAVKWVVPYSLGDSHRGFRVVGTTVEFYQRYRFRQDGRITFVAGRAATADSEVVIGSDVAERLRYTIGTPVVVVHGLRDIGTSSHETHPFRVVGILGRTFTPIDRSVYVTLEGIEAMHDEVPGAAPVMAASTPVVRDTPASKATDRPRAQQPVKTPAITAARVPAVMPGASPPPGTPMVMPGASPPAGTPMVMPGASPPPGTPMVMPGASPPPGPPMVMPGAEPPPSASRAVKRAPVRAAIAAPAAADSSPVHDHGNDQITAFFVGTKNRFEALMLQREMNTDLAEPLTAIIPGVALGELWQNIGSAEVGLRVVAAFAVAIGLTGMLVALYSSLESRRREMAILRAIGAGPRTIISLLVLESGLLAILGCALGVAFVYAGLALAQAPIEQRFGLHLALRPLGSTEWRYLALVTGAGILIGFVPAWKAYRTSLVDGLSPRA